jgi:hypothetical protein
VVTQGNPPRPQGQLEGHMHRGARGCRRRCAARVAPHGTGLSAILPRRGARAYGPSETSRHARVHHRGTEVHTPGKGGVDAWRRGSLARATQRDDVGALTAFHCI